MSRPTTRQQAAEATDSSAQAVAGDTDTSFTVTAAIPAVDVRSIHGVAIGTGLRLLVTSPRQPACVQTAPIARTASGSRRLKRNGCGGPVTSSATAPATAAAVARTRRRDRPTATEAGGGRETGANALGAGARKRGSGRPLVLRPAVKRVGDPESTSLHVPPGKLAERDAAMCVAQAVARYAGRGGSGVGVVA